MEVWHKAGDYWRVGLRIGDTLPKIVPPCRITRLPEGGWIALFPNEMHLLEESNLPKIDGGDDAANDFDNDLESVSTVIDAMAEDAAEASAAESAACEAESSVLTDDTDGDSTDEDRHQCDVEDTAEASLVGASPLGVGDVQVREQREILAERRHQRRLERERMQRSYEERMEREAREAEQAAREEERRKIFAAVGAVAVTAVMIYFFGLLGPAVFGLLCGGLLKG